VKNRAKEIADMLSDTEKIKEERKKARLNRNKYTGVASDQARSGFGAFSGEGGGGGSKYQGFGSDSFQSGKQNEKKNEKFTHFLLFK